MQVVLSNSDWPRISALSNRTFCNEQMLLFFTDQCNSYWFHVSIMHSELEGIIENITGFVLINFNSYRLPLAEQVSE